jgi:hypothetical protein
MAVEPTVQRQELWDALVETVHALPMYTHHKRYVENVLLVEKPELQARELAILLNIPYGEALVLISELTGKMPQAQTQTAESKGKTLFDFSGK